MDKETKAFNWGMATAAALVAACFLTGCVEHEAEKRCTAKACMKSTSLIGGTDYEPYSSLDACTKAAASIARTGKKSDFETIFVCVEGEDLGDSAGEGNGLQREW